MLGYLYWQDQGGEVPTVQSDIMKGTLNVGMAVGQLMFGVLGDALGRHKVYGKELLITLFGTLMVILLPWNNFDKQSIVAWIACFRVVTGIGIGAGKILKKSTNVSNLKAYNYLDYPMSSSLSAESTPLGSRAVLSLSVFASMGLGNISASITFLVLLEAFQSGVESNIHYVEWVWRLFLGLGMIPAAITLYARWTMAETAPYEKCMFHSYQTAFVRGSQPSRCIEGHERRAGRQTRPKRAVSGLCSLFQRMETCQGPLCNLCVLVSLVSINSESLMRCKLTNSVLQ